MGESLVVKMFSSELGVGSWLLFMADLREFVCKLESVIGMKNQLLSGISAYLQRVKIINRIKDILKY